MVSALLIRTQLGKPSIGHRVFSRRLSIDSIEKITSLFGDLTGADARIGVHADFGIPVVAEPLCLLPADFADECIASAAAATVEFEILVVLRIDPGYIRTLRERSCSRATAWVAFLTIIRFPHLNVRGSNPGSKITLGTTS